MKKSLIVIFLLMISFLAHAAPRGKALVVKGTVTFAGKMVKANSLISGNGEFVVGDQSFLKLLLEESGHTIFLGPNSAANINFTTSKENPEASLVKGIARWVSGAGSKTGGIKTKNTVMGIRGTDFFASYLPLLGETEIICFDGSVNFQNAADPQDSKLVSKNQWGGLGGRFGNSIGKILDLTPEIISHFQGALPLE